MTIATELNRIISAKNDILSAINDKGVSTAGTTSISQCPALINAIVTGGGGGTPTLLNSSISSEVIYTSHFNITATQIPVSAYDYLYSSLSMYSTSTTASGTALVGTFLNYAYKRADMMFDPSVRDVGGLSAAWIPMYSAGTAVFTVGVRNGSANNRSSFYASSYTSAALTTANSGNEITLAASNITGINSALSAHPGRLLAVRVELRVNASLSSTFLPNYNPQSAYVSASAMTPTVTGTALPYPDRPESSVLPVDVTARSVENITGSGKVSASYLEILFPKTGSGSRFYTDVETFFSASGSPEDGADGAYNPTVKSARYQSNEVTPGFSMYNAFESAQSSCTGSAVYNPYHVTYGTSDYSFSAPSPETVVPVMVSNTVIQ
jgi:hypothetical protein